ncbi:hypothetical protein M9Y10_034068 [Tritrichomonas musculus]|uniref:Uncharacterized protein n=1 Tax=Tritrichomonas musculus TaxID=1915356 RepID=A0ABR2KFV3_9EUKA
MFNQPEPKSWGELLKQREAERNQPPPKEAYIPPEITIHKEGGIFPDTNFSPDPDANPSSDNIVVDTHFYSNTSIFDEQEEKPRPHVIARDHGNEPFIWPMKTKYERELEQPVKQTRTSYRDIKTRDFDMITGVPYENGFKSTVKRLLDQKEKSNTFRMNRSFDPISNTFPTDELETTRLRDEALAHQATVTAHLEKMPKTLQRSQNGTLNIITGECTDDNSLSAINEFPNSSIARGQNRWARETEIINTRQIQKNKEIERVGCRYNNGRERMLRDFNIISNAEESHTMDVSVKHKPSVWQWCQSERLDT